jgi:hypothetical protein
MSLDRRTRCVQRCGMGVPLTLLTVGIPANLTLNWVLVHRRLPVVRAR